MEVSRDDALMEGASAVIAVTPQMDVPAANNLPSLGDRLAFFAAQAVRASEAGAKRSEAKRSVEGGGG